MTHEEIEWLRGRLREAGALEGAQSIQAALAAVYQLLIDNGLDHIELRPISRLQGALDDHARGKPHPLLEKSHRPGQRSHTADDMFRCCVAATATLFVSELGYKKPEALAKIAAALHLPVSRVRTWHHEIINARHANGGALEQYTALLEELRPRLGHDQAANEAALLKALQPLAREKV